MKQMRQIKTKNNEEFASFASTLYKAKEMGFNPADSVGISLVQKDHSTAVRASLSVRHRLVADLSTALYSRYLLEVFVSVHQ
jgi:hypothetical protein